MQLLGEVSGRSNVDGWVRNSQTLEISGRERV